MKYLIALFVALPVSLLIVDLSHASGYGRFGDVTRINQYQHNNQNQRQKLNNTNNAGDQILVGDKFQRNAPSFGLSAMFPTSVCQGTLTGGFSFWLGGGAVGTSYTVEECMKIETIRVGTEMQQKAVTVQHMEDMQQANKEVFCMLKHAAPTKMCGGNGVEPLPVMVEPDDPFKTVYIRTN